MNTRIVVCAYCKQEFTVESGRKTNAIKYCETCRNKARAEKNREYVAQHRRKHKQSENRGWMLGESRLNEHPCTNWKKEENTIKKEMRRLGI